MVVQKAFCSLLLGSIIFSGVCQAPALASSIEKTDLFVVDGCPGVIEGIRRDSSFNILPNKQAYSDVLMNCEDTFEVHFAASQLIRGKMKRIHAERAVQLATTKEQKARALDLYISVHLHECDDLGVGCSHRLLRYSQEALVIDPESQIAVWGIVDASFALGDYRTVIRLSNEQLRKELAELKSPEEFDVWMKLGQDNIFRPGWTKYLFESYLLLGEHRKAFNLTMELSGTYQNQLPFESLFEELLHMNSLRDHTTMYQFISEVGVSAFTEAIHASRDPVYKYHSVMAGPLTSDSNSDKREDGSVSRTELVIALGHDCLRYTEREGAPKYFLGYGLMLADLARAYELQGDLHTAYRVLLLSEQDFIVLKRQYLAKHLQAEGTVIPTTPFEVPPVETATPSIW